MFRLRLLLLFGLLILALAVYPAAAQSGIFWVGEYFNNTSLAVTPALVISEASPTHNWGSASPSPAIAADNFSARWTSVQNLAAGTYQITVTSDDGVRVYVNGILYINGWQNATGTPYTTLVPLTAGAHNFVVEYYEGVGSAFITYTLALVTAPTPLPTPIPSTALATVTTNQLNVRDRPDPFSGTVLTRIRSGETYPIIGRNADTSWLQLNVNGLVGWVNARYVSAINLQLVPVTNPGVRPTPPPPTPVPGSAFATVTAFFLNVRQTPDPVNGVVIARISRGQMYPIVGRLADNRWLLLNVNGLNGWVNARFVNAINLQSVPVVGGNPAPITLTATVVTGNLNVRQIPDPINGAIVARISLGQTFNAIGRNAAGTWAQLNVNGVIGWVNARYVALSGSIVSLPVTG